MNDFVKSIKQGLKNAERAGVNRKAIESLISELSAAVVEASGGGISRVELASSRRTVPLPNIHPISPAKPIPGRVVEYDALVAVPKADSGIEPVELCEIRIAAAGFPVTLSWGNTDVRCLDARALRKALNDLLEHPTIGERLQSLMAVAT